MFGTQVSGQTFKPVTLLALLISLTLAGNSFAVLVAGESFDYAAGTALNSGSLNGGIGWAGAWQGTGNLSAADQIETADIAPPTGYLGAAGNQLLLDTDLPSFNLAVTAKRELSQNIDLSPTSEQTYYVSFLLRRDDGFNGGGSENSRYFELLDSLGTVVVYAGTTSGEAAEVSLTGFAGASAGTAGELALNTDTLGLVKLVLRPDGQNDEIYLSYLTEGDDLSSEPTTWMASTTADTSGVMTTLSVTPAKFTDLTRYDELRIGTTLNDVLRRPVAHDGDANGDGMVNLADLQILGDNWQSTSATWYEADFNGDDSVNLADLQIIGDNWGYGTSPDISFDEALTTVSIPEPVSFILLLTACSGLLISKRSH